MLDQGMIMAAITNALADAAMPGVRRQTDGKDAAPLISIEESRPAPPPVHSGERTTVGALAVVPLTGRFSTASQPLSCSYSPRKTRPIVNGLAVPAIPLTMLSEVMNDATPASRAARKGVE